MPDNTPRGPTSGQLPGLLPNMHAAWPASFNFWTQPQGLSRPPQFNIPWLMNMFAPQTQPPTQPPITQPPPGGPWFPPPVVGPPSRPPPLPGDPPVTGGGGGGLLGGGGWSGGGRGTLDF